MRKKVDQHLSYLDFHFEGRRKVRTSCCFPGDGFHNAGVRMTKWQGAECHHPVDIFISIDIIEPRSTTV